MPTLGKASKYSLPEATPVICTAGTQTVGSSSVTGTEGITDTEELNTLRLIITPQDQGLEQSEAAATDKEDEQSEMPRLSKV